MMAKAIEKDKRLYGEKLKSLDDNYKVYPEWNNTHQSTRNQVGQTVDNFAPKPVPRKSVTDRVLEKLQQQDKSSPAASIPVPAEAPLPPKESLTEKIMKKLQKGN